MHIGVDARSMAGNGIGRYACSLASALEDYSNLDMKFYTPFNMWEGSRSNFAGVNIRFKFAQNRFSNILWSQTALPYHLSRDDIDLFWGPAHRIPQFLCESIARVVTIHDLVWKLAPQTMRPMGFLAEKIFMPQAIKLSDLILATSQSTANDVAYFFPQHAHKVRVVHLGACDLPNPPSDSPLKCGVVKPFFLFVGTIEPRKNLDRLLQSFAILPDCFRDRFTMAIAGGYGWGSIDLESIVKRHGLEKSVKILGYVTDEQLADLYSQARFLVIPSLYEGFGLPLVEAMKYGTPLLTSNTSSMPEIAGDASVFVNPLSVESISKALERMLSDDTLIHTLREKALMRSKNFTWEKCASQTMDVFKEALSLRNARISL